MSAHGKCLLRVSMEEAIFRSCNVNSGRKLLPWSLAEDMFSEHSRKKQSFAVVMSTVEESFFRGVSQKTSSARLHGRSILPQV
ncbi:hypothetical protein HKD37_12G034552 [Glycine soja]